MGDKISMPSSGGGLMRYFDDYKSKIQIPPSWIIIFVAIVIVVMIIIEKSL